MPSADRRALHFTLQVSSRVLNAKSERYYKAGLGKKKQPGFWQVSGREGGSGSAMQRAVQGATGSGRTLRGLRRARCGLITLLAEAGGLQIGLQAAGPAAPLSASAAAAAAHLVARPFLLRTCRASASSWQRTRSWWR